MGTRERGITLDAVRRVFDRAERPGTPLTASEVAEEVGCVRRTAHSKLRELAEAGDLRTKKVGARGRVWWRPVESPSGSGGDGADGDGTDGAQFRSLVEAVEEYAIFRLDADGRVRSWNAGAERIEGYERDEILGEHVSTFYTDADREAGVPERNLAVAAEDGNVEDEGWRVRADGTRFWATVTITAVRDDDGDLQGYVKVTREMTDRREREQQLRSERDLVERIFETSPVGLGVLSRDGLERVNARAARIYGSPGDVDDYAIGEPDVYDEGGRPVPAEERPTARVFETGESVEGWECQLEGADGRRRWLSVSAAPLRDDGGGVDRVVVAVEDVTGLKKQARRLERQRDDLESELADVFERVDDAFYGLDETFRFTYVNGRAEELLQASAGELLGENVWERFPAAADTPALEAFETAMESQEPTRFETYFEPLSFWVEANVYPSDTGLSVYFRDVTERKEREHELERYVRIVDAVGHPVYELDERGRITFVNDAFVERSGYEESELLGEHVSVGMDEEAVARVESHIADLVADDPDANAALEYEVLTKDGERVPVENHLTLLTDDDGRVRGSAGVMQDITERRERERELELYETIVSAIEDGVYVLDEEFRFTMVNDAYAEMTGYDRDELLGTHCTLVIDEDVSAESERLLEEMVAGEGGSAALEADILRADGSRLRAESNFTALRPDGDEPPRKVGVVRDVSERVERERELEESRRRYKTLVENFPNGAVALVDEELRYVTVGGTPLDAVDTTIDDLVGSSVEEALPPALAEVLVPRYSDALDGVESEFEREVGDEIFQFRVLPVRDDDGDVFAALGMSQDVTERIAYERVLRTRMDQQAVVAELGWRALEERDLDALLADASRLVAEILDTDYCKVLDLDDDADELLLREGVGWRDGIVGSATVSAVENDSQAAYTLASAGPVIVEDLRTESRFGGPDLLTSHDVRSGISVVIGPQDDPWGILGTHDTERREFSEHDAAFVQSVATVLASAIRRHHDEERLRQQRERLAALDDLNGVVRDITEAVIEQSTREEIEETVCERLAASDSYRFAWIGAVDETTQTVTARTEAGAGEYLDGITISVDPEDERSDGPTGRAVLEGETVVARDVLVESSHEPWRDRVEEYEFRSSAAIPIRHEGTLYGVLNVYADRPHAFDESERAVVGQLGEVVGHVIAAIDRKRALMSDEVTELRFRVRDVFGALDLPVSTDGRITFDEAVPVGDGVFLEYGTATEDAIDALEAVGDHLPHWESVSVREPEAGVAKFELRLDGPPVLSAIASSGGYIEEMVVEDGDVRMTVHLSPTVEARRIIDVVEESYPAAEMVARRQTSRPADAADRLSRTMTADLTDRQRAALDAAYHSGFFEWPREATGEDVAASLGVSSPTFYQHLRKAENKLLSALYGAPASATT